MTRRRGFFSVVVTLSHSSHGTCCTLQRTIRPNVTLLIGHDTHRAVGPGYGINGLRSYPYSWPTQGTPVSQEALSGSSTPAAAKALTWAMSWSDRKSVVEGKGVEISG